MYSYGAPTALAWPSTVFSRSVLHAFVKSTWTDCARVILFLMSGVIRRRKAMVPPSVLANSNQ